MDAQDFWYSSGATGGGGGDPGDPIGQSLRFGAGRVLTRTAATMQTSWTASWWFKYAIADAQSSERIMCANGSSSSYIRIGTFTTPTNLLGFPGSFSPANFGGALRDPSAWYNIVVQNTTTGTTVWLNGVEQGTGSSLGTQDLFTRIGNNQNPNAFNGLMADWYLLDGQAVAETTFGRFNDDGVWVPVEPNLTAAQFGARGFHLTFADPDNLGEDSAPIGATGHTAANNYTATGFDTDPRGIFSNDLFTSQTPFNVNSTARNFLSLNPANNSSPPASFDNVANNWAQGATAADLFCIWRPDTPLTNVTSVQLECASPMDDMFINGTSTGQNTTGDTRNSPFTLTLPAASITLTSVAMEGDASAAGQKNFWCRLWVGQNGAAATVLVDNTGEGYDSMQDSPTQNYATLNPLNTVSGSDNGIGNANLENQDTNGNQASTWTGTISMSGSLNYFEVTRLESDSSLTYGIVPDDLLITEGNVGLTQGAWINQAGTLGITGTNTANYLPAIAEGDTVNVAFNSTNGRIWFGRNGTFVGDPAAGTNPAGTLNMDTGWVPWVRCLGASGLERAAINCGQQQPFLYTVPNGFEALQTQELQTPPILNGRDSYQAPTSAGANILADAQAIFGTGMWWVKDLDNSQQYQFVDSVRGQVGGQWQAIQCPGPAAGTNPTVNYAAPTGNSIAMSWNSANPETTGFNIITWTGNGSGANRNIPHGLGGECGMFWGMNMEANNSTNAIGFVSNGMGRNNGEMLVLNDDAGSVNANSFNAGILQIGDATNVVLRVGSVNDDNYNRNGFDYVGYVWREIPGYSMFGQYRGNQSNNGPFVYCGFRPAFIMMKAISQTDHWTIYNSSTNVNNPAINTLRPDVPNAEGHGTTNAIDILSNGFKIRTSVDQVNRNNPMIFAAFAENPFGGENTAPVTAR